MSREGVTEALKILRSGGYRVPPGLMPQASTSERVTFVEAWDDALTNTSDEVLKEAARRWVRRQATFPPLSEFLTFTRATENDLRPPAPPLTTDTGDGGRVGTLEERKAHLAKIREEIASATGPLFRGTGGMTIDPTRGAT